MIVNLFYEFNTDVKTFLVIKFDKCIHELYFNYSKMFLIKHSNINNINKIKPNSMMLVSK